MRRLIRFTICTALVNLTLNYAIQAQNYEVTAIIQGAEGVTFNLQKNVTGKVVYMGKGVIKDGELKISGGSVNYPEFVSLVTQDKSKGLSFFLENSKITITGKIDSLGMAKVTGSKTQDEYIKLRAALIPFTDKSNQLGREYQAASKAGDKAKMNDLYMKNDILRYEMVKVQKKFIIDNPSSYATPTILGNLMNIKLLKAAELDSLAKLVSPEVTKVTEMEDLRQKINALLKVDIGQKAPDFKQPDVTGKQVSLSSVTGPKLLLIDFWAAWCSPCRQENPNVVKTWNDFHSKGFDVLGVSLDRKREDWIKAIADDKLTWTHVSDLKYFQNEAAVLYSVNAIPSNFLLNENGIIIAKNLRGENLYNKVKELLGSE